MPISPEDGPKVIQFRPRVVQPTVSQAARLTQKQALNLFQETFRYHTPGTVVLRSRNGSDSSGKLLHLPERN